MPTFFCLTLNQPQSHVRQGKKPSEMNTPSVTEGMRQQQQGIFWKMESLSTIGAQSKCKQQSKTRPACNL